MSPKVKDFYKEQKKQRILDAAKKVFIKNGYESVTMKDIIDESGLSRGGVYLYFSSTEQIFLSLLESSDNSFFSLINRLDGDNGAAWKTVIRLIEAVKDQMLSINEGLAPAIYEYFLSVKRNEQVKPLLAERFCRAEHSLNALLEKGVQNGEFRPKLPLSEISKFLLLFMDGVAVNMIHLRGESIDINYQTAQLLLYLEYALEIESSK